MPVLDEAANLADAVAAVLRQEYAGDLEVVLALGPSSDGTDAVAARLADGDSRVRSVPNPSGRTPDGLNAAIAAASGEVIVRVDAHSELPAGYIARAVDELFAVGADNVGGTMAAAGRTPFERAVAAAMRSRIGVGSSAFRTGAPAGEVDTVYLGVFRRSALERVGGFDPAFTRTQDWELNHRIRRTGGKVWFTPELVVTYRPRSTVRALARQYFQYGQWRHAVTRLHPETVSARYLAAPVMVAGTTAATVLGLWWLPALAVPAAYLAAVGVGGVVISAGEPPAARALTPVTLAVMHWSWGLGHLTSPRRLGR